MNCEKVVIRKYTLDENEINSLKQTKRITKELCELMCDDCNHCFFRQTCLRIDSLNNFIDDIIKKNEQNLKYFS